MSRGELTSAAGGVGSVRVGPCSGEGQRVRQYMGRPFTLFATVMVLVGVMAGCSNSGSATRGSSENSDAADDGANTGIAATATTAVAPTATADAPVTTTTAVATTSTAPATTARTGSQNALLTFDAEQCIYQGPSEGVLSEPLNLELTNNSDVAAIGRVSWVPPDFLGEVMPTVGTDFPLSDGRGGMMVAFYVEAQSGTVASTGAFVPAPGTYVLDCESLDGATVLHTWRPAAIEFSP